MDLVKENMEEYALDHLYTLTIGKQEEYINPIADDSLIWWSIQSTGEYLEVTFDNWK